MTSNYLVSVVLPRLYNTREEENRDEQVQFSNGHRFVHQIFVLHQLFKQHRDFQGLQTLCIPGYSHSYRLRRQDHTVELLFIWGTVYLKRVWVLEQLYRHNSYRSRSFRRRLSLSLLPLRGRRYSTSSFAGLTQCNRTPLKNHRLCHQVSRRYRLAQWQWTWGLRNRG